jgi:hypothetical protein
MKKNYLILDYVNFVGLLTKIYDIKYHDNYSVLLWTG